MQQINVNELKPHPQNDYFFDDIKDENWDAFLESIRTSGVIEPVIVTQEKITVSGHQRIRGCKELGITTIPCDIRIYETEDQLLKDLIETNLRQRGIGNTNPTKLGRCIMELERIYGISHGGDRARRNNFVLKSQEDLANDLGLEVRTMQNYKKLTTLIPELEDLVETGIVTPTTALSIVRNMSSEEQEEFVSSMDVTKKITNKQVQQYIEENKSLKVQSNELIIKLNKMQNLQLEVDELKNELELRPNKEVKPLDYDSTKKQLSDYKKDYNTLQSDYERKTKELLEVKKQIESLNEVTPQKQYSKKLKDSAIFFCGRVNDFIEKTGGFIWLTEHINELPDYERKSYLSAVNAMSDWSETLKNNINK